jgi:hypothetical protein
VGKSNNFDVLQRQPNDYSSFSLKHQPLTLASAIKYAASIKINADGTIPASRCNCTFCQKLGLTNASLDGPSDFKLLSPDSSSGLGDYTRLDTAHKYFCQKCGVHVWAGGSYEYEGTKHDFFTINLATVDQPQEGVDLSKVKVQYCDGLHDNWFAGLKDVPWPGGLP